MPPIVPITRAQTKTKCGVRLLAHWAPRTSERYASRSLSSYIITPKEKRSYQSDERLSKLPNRRCSEITITLRVGTRDGPQHPCALITCMIDHGREKGLTPIPFGAVEGKVNERVFHQSSELPHSPLTSHANPSDSSCKISLAIRSAINSSSLGRRSSVSSVVSSLKPTSGVDESHRCPPSPKSESTRFRCLRKTRSSDCIPTRARNLLSDHPTAYRNLTIQAVLPLRCLWCWCQ